MQRNHQLFRTIDSQVVSSNFRNKKTNRKQLENNNNNNNNNKNKKIPSFLMFFFVMFLSRLEDAAAAGPTVHFDLIGLDEPEASDEGVDQTDFEMGRTGMIR